MPFTPQNFVDNVGPSIKSTWLNPLDVTVNFVLNGAQTVAAAQAALGIVFVGAAASFAAMRGFAVPNANSVAVALGKNTPNDGGGGIYYWNAADSRPDNGSTIIAVTANGSNIGRYNQLFGFNFAGLAGEGALGGL